MKTFILACATAALLAMANGASAQAYVGYAPAGPLPYAGYYTPLPVVAYAPGIPVYAPRVSYYGAYYAAPVPYPYNAYAALPAVQTAYYAPYAPAPVAVAPVAVAPVYGPPVYGPTVIVHPKVYVRGEPVRNALRAVTP